MTLKIQRNFRWFLLVGYLCLCMAIIPARSSAALLESEGTSGESGIVTAGRVEKMIRTGFNFEEARERARQWNESWVAPSFFAIRLGGNPPQDYDPPMNNIGYVFLLIACGVVLAGVAANQTSKN